jgi:hypothetical protein
VCGLELARGPAPSDRQGDHRPVLSTTRTSLGVRVAGHIGRRPHDAIDRHLFGDSLKHSDLR